MKWGHRRQVHPQGLKQTGGLLPCDMRNHIRCVLKVSADVGYLDAGRSARNGKTGDTWLYQEIIFIFSRYYAVFFSHKTAVN